MSVDYGRLTTEQRNPQSAHIDQADARGIVGIMLAEEQHVTEAVTAVADDVAAAIELAAERLGRGGRLFYIGAGTSGRLAALDASECPPTFGTDPEQVQAVIAGGPAALLQAVEHAEDDRENGAADLLARRIGPDDLAIGISASGVTPYVLGAVEGANWKGAATAMIVCNCDAELPPYLDVAIRLDTGPEVVTGSTRLKAGTATKLTLNMISTGAMIRLGKVYGNLMVDVKTNSHKLRDRARRILEAVTGLDKDTAAALLEQTHDLKTALVMQLAGVEEADAQARLAAAGGQVRAAVEAGS